MSYEKSKIEPQRNLERNPEAIIEDLRTPQEIKEAFNTYQGLELINNSKNIILINIFDDFQSKNNIEKILTTLRSISKENFAFSTYSKSRIQFNNIIYEIVKEYLDNLKSLKQSGCMIQQHENSLKGYNEALKRYQTEIETLNTPESTDINSIDIELELPRGKIEELNKEIKSIDDHQINPLMDKIEELKNEEKEINNNNPIVFWKGKITDKRILLGKLLGWTRKTFTYNDNLPFVKVERIVENTEGKVIEEVVDGEIVNKRFYNKEKIILQERKDQQSIVCKKNGRPKFWFDKEIYKAKEGKYTVRYTTDWGIDGNAEIIIYGESRLKRDNVNQIKILQRDLASQEELLEGAITQRKAKVTQRDLFQRLIDISVKNNSLELKVAQEIRAKEKEKIKKNILDQMNKIEKEKQIFQRNMYELQSQQEGAVAYFNEEKDFISMVYEIVTIGLEYRSPLITSFKEEYKRVFSPVEDVD